MHILATSTANRLYFADNDSGNSHHVRYIDLWDLAENPRISTTRVYGTAARMELPEWDYGQPGEAKSLWKVRIKCPDAASDRAVAVYYRLDDSEDEDDWEQLGSNVIVESEQVLYFGADHEGVGCNSVQLAVAFTSPGSTAAPKLEYLELEGALRPEVLKQFAVRLALTEMFDQQTPQAQRQSLYEAMTSPTAGTFVYRDPSEQTERRYLVAVGTPQGPQEAGKDSRGFVDLQLLEISPHV